MSTMNDKQANMMYDDERRQVTEITFVTINDKKNVH